MKYKKIPANRKSYKLCVKINKTAETKENKFRVCNDNCLQTK